MKVMVALVALLIFSSGAFAQTLDDRIKTLEEALKKQEQTIKEQQKLIEELKAEMSRTQGTAPAAANQAQTPAAEVQQQVQELKEKVDRVAEAQQKVVPSVFNPAIGLVGETVFSYNNKPSSETGSGRPGGWDVFQRSVELNATASIDPFLQGYVVLNASADPVTGESTAQVRRPRSIRPRCHGTCNSRRAAFSANSAGCRISTTTSCHLSTARWPSTSTSAANRRQTGCRSTISCPSPIT